MSASERWTGADAVVRGAWCEAGFGAVGITGAGFDAGGSDAVGIEAAGEAFGVAVEGARVERCTADGDTAVEPVPVVAGVSGPVPVPARGAALDAGASAARLGTTGGRPVAAGRGAGLFRGTARWTGGGVPGALPV
ncbi:MULTISPECIES: hypothetical protein [unclassified Streptomyces]|uniref:hypothetical protein n=1 Tax=unclassified Streptomyces TaxID=2593676 RepID=UPI0033224CDF